VATEAACETDSSVMASTTAATQQTSKIATELQSVFISLVSYSYFTYISNTSSHHLNVAYNGHILCMRQNEKGFYTNFAKSFLLIETIMYCIIVSYPYHQIKCQKLEKSGEHAVPEPSPQRRSTAG